MRKNVSNQQLSHLFFFSSTVLMFYSTLGMPERHCTNKLYPHYEPKGKTKHKAGRKMEHIWMYTMEINVEKNIKSIKKKG